MTVIDSSASCWLFSSVRSTLPRTRAVWAARNSGSERAAPPFAITSPRGRRPCSPIGRLYMNVIKLFGSTGEIVIVSKEYPICKRPGTEGRLLFRWLTLLACDGRAYSPGQKRSRSPP